jgi:hypothetical protein
LCTISRSTSAQAARTTASAIVEDVVPGTRASFADGGGPDNRSYQVDCSKIARVLPEFEPRWTVRRGVEQLYEAYARNRLTFEQFTGTGTRYLRINRVRELQGGRPTRRRTPLACAGPNRPIRLDRERRWTPAPPTNAPHRSLRIHALVAPLCLKGDRHLPRRPAPPT